MSSLIWSFNDLVEHTGSDDPEVRYWAIDRLVRHFPAECPDAIARFVLDDHDATPLTVARHLAHHGTEKHHAVLVRGFRLLRGEMPAHCLRALALLGYPDVVSLASDALVRGGLTEPAQARVLEALAELGTPEARELVREHVARKVELLAEPAALRATLVLVSADEIGDTLARMMTALQWRGSHRAAEAFRTLMDVLGIDDAGWCFRTGPSGHIELRKTIKAVESGYDCDIFATMGEATIKQIAQRIRAGNRAEVVRALADWTRAATSHLPPPTEGDLPARIAAAVSAMSDPILLADAARLGRQFEQWVLGFQLSAAFAVARGQTARLSLQQERGDLDRLLLLAEVETAFHVTELPAAIAEVCRDDPERSHRAQDWCLRMLEAQGPFFPRVVALETLGELRSIHFIPEVMEYLSEENSYIYGAAERALSRMGEAIVAPAVARIESATLDPDAAHSLLVLLCDLGTRGAYEAVLRHLDWFMETVGPGTTAEWASLFGTDELIDPLRDWLEEDPAMIGQGLLLLCAIHEVQIPEEAEILRAIEDERARQAAEEDEDDPAEGSEGGGDYLM